MNAPIVASTASAGEKKLRYSAFGTTEPLPFHNMVKGYHGLDSLAPTESRNYSLIAVISPSPIQPLSQRANFVPILTCGSTSSGDRKARGTFHTVSPGWMILPKVRMRKRQS